MVEEKDWEQLKKDLAEGHLSVAERELLERIKSTFKAKDKELQELRGLLMSHGYNGGLWDSIKKLLTPKKKSFDEQQADYWDNKWPKASITYGARGYKGKRHRMDVRNTMVTKSVILQSYKKSGTYDNIALALLREVKRKITYVSDSHNYNEAEYWQAPEITLSKGNGDCEDGALLLASLMRMSGIPAYRVKVCAGWVKTSSGRGGHAYVIYLADDGNWYPLDWCYYGTESERNFKKIPHKDNSKYQEIWWTFNDQYAWSQKDTRLGK
jgi:hypothetical protein